MVGQHHQLKGHEFVQTLGDSEGLGGLACCSPWGRKELDMTQRLNNNNKETLLELYLMNKWKILIFKKYDHLKLRTCFNINETFLFFAPKMYL